MPDHNEAGPEDLSQLRKSIDDLDRKIVELLSERARVVVAVGRTKQVAGTPIYAPDREQAVLQRIAEVNRGHFPRKLSRPSTES